MSKGLTPQIRAEKSANALLAADPASRGLGMTITRIAPGTASVEMIVRPDMLNGHGICHGGFLFLLADSAFAFACNSYNQRVVAQQNQITFLAPAREGDRLTAHAIEVSRAGRSGTYDVTVTNPGGERLALLRGLSRTVRGQHFLEPTDDTP